MASKKPSSIFTSNMSPWNSLPDALKGSAHDVWLAGLAALSRAQQEGSKVVEALVQEGEAIQRKTQTAAQEKAREASELAQQLASQLGDKASGQWSKLESIFEDRVARALQGLGMPTASDVQSLTDRVTALEKAMAANTRPARAQSAPRNQTSSTAKQASSRGSTSRTAALPRSPSSSQTNPRTPRTSSKTG